MFNFGCIRIRYYSVIFSICLVTFNVSAGTHFARFFSQDRIEVLEPSAERTQLSYEFSHNNGPISGVINIENEPEELLSNNDFVKLSQTEKDTFYKRRNMILSLALKSLWLSQSKAKPFMATATRILRKVGQSILTATQGVYVTDLDMPREVLDSEKFQNISDKTVSELNQFLCAFAHKVANVEEIQLALTVGAGASGNFSLSEPQSLTNMSSKPQSFLFGANMGISVGVNFKTQELIFEVISDMSRLLRHYMPTIGGGGSIKLATRFITETDRKGTITGYGSMLPFSSFGIDSYQNEMAISTILPGLPGGATPGISLGHNTLVPLVRVRFSRFGFSIASAFGLTQLPRVTFASREQWMSIIKPQALSQTSLNELEWVTSKVDPVAQNMRRGLLVRIHSIASRLGMKALSDKIGNQISVSKPSENVCSQVFYFEN